MVRWCGAVVRGVGCGGGCVAVKRRNGHNIEQANQDATHMDTKKKNVSIAVRWCSIEKCGRNGPNQAQVENTGGGVVLHLTALQLEAAEAVPGGSRRRGAGRWTGRRWREGLAAEGRRREYVGVFDAEHAVEERPDLRVVGHPACTRAGGRREQGGWT